MRELLRGIVYRLNRMGPRIEPCGTPEMIGRVLENLSW